MREYVCVCVYKGIEKGVCVCVPISKSKSITDFVESGTMSSQHLSRILQTVGPLHYDALSRVHWTIAGFLQK